MIVECVCSVFIEVFECVLCLPRVYGWYMHFLFFGYIIVGCNGLSRYYMLILSV